jgi:nitrogen fixation protein NifB
MIDIERHPCFNKEAKMTHTRLHLPVAPKCNVQCNFCNRQYDCVNESRPGVTSNVLTPEQALMYVKEYHAKRRISVVGIAGPGDPFANPEETMETLRLIREEFPEMLLCVSTNGLNLLPYIDELAELKVSHVTITVCAVDPEIAKNVYAWIRPEKKPYRGNDAGEMIIERQLAAIPELKKHGMIVKINSIVIPTVNEDHIEEVAKVTSNLGADIINPMALIPTEGSEFADLEAPDSALVNSLKRDLSTYMSVMSHCMRCRADAAGLLGEDNIEETSKMLEDIKNRAQGPSEQRPYVAVATNEGLLVNRHLGEADYFEIYTIEDGSLVHVESRKAPEKGGGEKRWEALGTELSDCAYILTSGVGEMPKKVLTKSGITVSEIDGMIEDALIDIYEGRDLDHRKVKPMKSCGSGCGGGGTGCG